MGPDTDPPNWLRLRNGRATPFLLLNQSFAESALFRLYQYALPCRLLDPDGAERTTELAFPPRLAFELEEEIVISWTSPIVSLLGM